MATTFRFFILVKPSSARQVRCFGLYRLGRLGNSEITPPTSARCILKRVTPKRLELAIKLFFYSKFTFAWCEE
jgi:hypothetical protein